MAKLVIWDGQKLYDIDGTPIVEWDPQPEPVPVPPPPQPDPVPIPPAGVKPVTVTWGLQSGDDPELGNGELKALLSLQGGIADIWIKLVFGKKTKHGKPGRSGTSRYYFSVPAEIWPSDLGFTAGVARAWIDGKEFDGAAFFYSRIPGAIVLTLGGQPWGVSRPLKMTPGSKVYVHVRYPLL